MTLSLFTPLPPGIIDKEEFHLWKNNLVDQLKQSKNYNMFLPGGEIMFFFILNLVSLYTMLCQLQLSKMLLVSSIEFCQQQKAVKAVSSRTAESTYYFRTLF